MPHRAPHTESDIFGDPTRRGRLWCLSGFYPYLSDLMGVETGTLWAGHDAWRQPLWAAFRAFAPRRCP